MSAHTPGPLIVNGYALEEDKPRGARVIGYSAGEPEDVDSGEVRANLRLWAAAPDLLEACKALLAEHDKITSRVSLDFALTAASVYARAAIAKARG